MNDMNDTDKLLRMKEKIETAKRKVAECDGQLKSLHKRLKDDFGCEDLKSADKELAAMDKDLSAKEKQLQQGITRLEEKYEW